MKNYVYTIYNNLSKRYGDVMAYPSDGFAIRRVQKVLSTQGMLSESELCRVGSIDIESGVITTEPPVRLTWEEESVVQK